ncbi:site-specific integrase [Anaerovoracaceae bacterium 41-7]
MAKQYKISRSFSYEGKRYFIKANSEAEYGAKKERKIQELRNDENIVRSDMTVRQWTKICIETYKTGQKEITRKKYVNRINHCILEHIGSMKLTDIKPIHCQTVLNRQEGNSMSQIIEVQNAMKFIFKKAVTNNLIRSNPAEDLVRPKAKMKQTRRAITDYEREHIIKVAQTKRKYYMYLLMLFCGCRPSEAAEAKGEDIIRIDGYNMLHIRGTKTAAADRFVPIPDELYILIKNTPETENIALYETGNQIKYENRNRVWNSFRRDLNISMGCKMYRNELIPPFPLAEDLVPYCLRHTYCTDLARSGIDIRVAQKLMGHTDIQLTANIYTNLDNSDIISAAKALKVSTPVSTL